VKKYSKLKKLVVLFRILSHGISALFHPLLLPTYIFILVGYFSPLAIAPLNSLEGRRFLIGLIFLSTFFLPFLLLALYIMIQNTRWTMKSFLLENSKERVFPFLIIAGFYSVLIYFIRLTPQLNEVILIVMSCVTVAILLVAIISNFWKISAHAVGASGMIAILAVLNNRIPDSTLFYPLIVLIVLAGCLMSARLYLNAHNPAQILAGTMLGLFVGGFSYIFL
jgi:membrane-associated phospholipid phosphatase